MKQFNSVMEKACAHIADAFRQERKDQNAILLQAHRVKELVENGRYGFDEACKLLYITTPQIIECFKWIVDDNARLNAAYDSDVHRQTSFDYSVVGWFQDQEENKIVQFPKAS